MPADPTLSPATVLFRELVRGRTGREDEERLLELLAEADADQLNEYLSDAEVTDELVSSVDNRPGGRRHRTQLLELLVDQRLGELNMTSKANLIHALQSGFTSRESEEAIRDIILAHRRFDLTRLKNDINSFHDQHDLEALVFADIQDQGIRDEILDHIWTQSRIVTIHETKVLSDIDDTVFCKLKDDRFPKGIRYPGVLAFWTALDEGPLREPVSMGDLTFVTARPTDALGLIENHTRETLRKAGVGQNSVLTGGFVSLLSRDRMANKKLENIKHYHALFPEYRLVFIGDSGQGDVKVGEHMVLHYPNHLWGVFIHDVVHTPAQQRSRYQRDEIYFFDTYVGAAAYAGHLQLIGDHGVVEVIRETRQEFAEIVWNSPAQQAAAEALLAADVALAKELTGVTG